MNLNDSIREFEIFARFYSYATLETHPVPTLLSTDDVQAGQMSLFARGLVNPVYASGIMRRHSIPVSTQKVDFYATVRRRVQSARSVGRSVVVARVLASISGFL